MAGGGACVAGGRAWQIPRDTVNERAVRILLGWTLVNFLREDYGQLRATTYKLYFYLPHL